MGTIVLLLLLAWLVCTALLTIRAGRQADRSLPTSDMVQQMTRITGPQDTLPPAIASNAPVGQDISSPPAMMD